MIETAKIFTNGHSQVVILPKDFRFYCDEVEVNRVGDIVILVPPKNKWGGMIQSLDMFTDDFMEDGRNDVKPK